MALTAPTSRGIQTAYTALTEALRAAVDYHNKNACLSVPPISVDGECLPAPSAGAHILLVVAPPLRAYENGDPLTRDQRELAEELAAGCSLTVLAFPPIATSPRRLPLDMSTKLAPKIEAVIRAAEPTCVVVLGGLAEPLFAGCGWGDVPTSGVASECVVGKGRAEFRHTIVCLPNLDLAREPAQASTLAKIWERIRSMPRPERTPPTTEFFARPSKRPRIGS